MRKIAYLIAFLCVNTFAQNLSDGLLLDYKFDGNADDSSGNSFHGINYRANFVEDRFGNSFSAVLFNGTDSYIDLPNSNELKPDLPISFAFWVRYDSEDYRDRDLFNTSFEEDVNTGVYFNSQISSGKYAVNYGDGSNNYFASTRSTYVSNTTIDVGVWRQIVVVISSSDDMKIYVDCVENQGEYSGYGNGLEYSNTAGSIGRHDRHINLPANYFKGALDDFRYWNRVLTDDEINLLCKECNHLGVTDAALNREASIIFPQPADGFISIKTSRIIDEIVILNSMGELVMAEVFKPHIDLAHLTSGIYFVKLISESQVETKKIIIK